MVPGPEVDNHFKIDEVQVCNTTYNLWCTKELGSVMKMMAAGGRISADDAGTTHCWVGNGVEMIKEFTYKRPFN